MKTRAACGLVWERVVWGYTSGDHRAVAECASSMMPVLERAVSRVTVSCARDFRPCRVVTRARIECWPWLLLVRWVVYWDRTASRTRVAASVDALDGPLEGAAWRQEDQDAACDWFLCGGVERGGVGG